MMDKWFWGLRAMLYAPFFGRFGMPSYLGKPIFLKGISKIFIGKKVRLFPHLRMEVHGEGRIVIQDEVSVQQNVHITAGGRLEIGKKTLILANSFITDIDHGYEEIGTHVLEQKIKITPTQIGENCFIGMGAAIMAGTVLGRQCVVGANSVVRGKFPDYSVIAGAPAKVIKIYNHERGEWEKV